MYLILWGFFADDGSSDDEDEGTSDVPATSESDGEDEDEVLQWMRNGAQHDQPPFNPSGPPGPVNFMPAHKTPLDFFKLFFTIDLFERIILETDRHARSLIETDPRHNKMTWHCPSNAEMMAFFGLCFLMGIVHKPKLKDYWSKHPLLHTPIFMRMKRDSFCQILRYFHLVNENPPQRPVDALWKVRWFIDRLNDSFSGQYIPHQHISIDEHMCPFKGKVHFKQYLPSKPTKWGIKLWALADSKNGYIQQLHVYSGKTDRPETSLAHHVVNTLLDKAQLLNKGYKLFIDNYYTSPELLRDLWEKDTPTCGTVKMNRKGNPKSIMCRNPKGLQPNRGSYVHRQSGPLHAYAWRDKRIVYVLSTLPSSVGSINRVVRNNGRWTKTDIQCPEPIVQYTKYMGGVDLADQYMGYYSFVKRRASKWTRKVIFDFIEAAKFNAYILYKSSPHHQPPPGKKQLSYLQFTLNLIDGLLAEYNNSQRMGRPALGPLDARLHSRCMPSRMENRSWCHVCWMKVSRGRQDKRAQTQYGCQTCQKHLCMPDCFRAFHTLKHYY